jgi:hypothetical protein
MTLSRFMVICGVAIVVAALIVLPLNIIYGEAPFAFLMAVCAICVGVQVAMMVSDGAWHE